MNFATYQYVSTTAYSTSLLTYAPEWVKNADNSTYLDGGNCPHLVMVSTNGSSSFSIIEQHPITNCSNPAISGTMWSTPVLMTQMDTYMLDPFIVFDGTNFNLFYVDIVLNTNQSIQYGTSTTLTGTYTKQSSGVNWTGFQNGGQINQEGPMLICMNYTTSCQQWRIFFDQIGNLPGDLADGQIFYSTSSGGSLSGTWSIPTNIDTTVQAKHGTVIAWP